MTKILLNNFPDTEVDQYVEVFGGGASLLFYKPRYGIEVYNDLYHNVYCLFKSLADCDNFKQLKYMMDLSVYSRRLHDEYREELNNYNLSIVERAYKYLYVNRTSFNGVGGFSVSKYIRRGMSKSTSDFLSMIDGLREVHDRLQSVIIEEMDALDLIEKYDDGRKALMYVDPPYIHSTRKSSQKYGVEMQDDDHKRLVEKLLRCSCNILLSCYDHEIYDPLQENGWTKIKLIRPNSNDVETIYRNYSKECDAND